MRQKRPATERRPGCELDRQRVNAALTQSILYRAAADRNQLTANTSWSPA
jgi:hypothetical protein